MDLRESPQSAPDRPQNHVPQLRRETAKSKLNSYERETNKTGSSYEKQTFSYDCCLTPICKSLQTRPQNHVPQLRRETAKSKLNSYERETNKTGSSYEKQTFSYDCCLTPICKSLQTRPQNHVPQLRRETAKSKLNSYERETNKTGSSYEKQTFSYDCCLTPICKSLQTRPQNHAPQLGLETKNPKLNSYDRETSKTGNNKKNATRPSFHASEMTR